MSSAACIPAIPAPTISTRLLWLFSLVTISASVPPAVLAEQRARVDVMPLPSVAFDVQSQGQPHQLAKVEHRNGLVAGMGSAHFGLLLIQVELAERTVGDHRLRAGSLGRLKDGEDHLLRD